MVLGWFAGSVRRSRTAGSQDAGSNDTLLDRLLGYCFDLRGGYPFDRYKLLGGDDDTIDRNFYDFVIRDGRGLTTMTCISVNKYTLWLNRSHVPSVAVVVVTNTTSVLVEVAALSVWHGVRKVADLSTVGGTYRRSPFHFGIRCICCGFCFVDNLDFGLFSTGRDFVVTITHNLTNQWHLSIVGVDCLLVTTGVGCSIYNGYI